MIKLRHIFAEAESREDKLRRMWTRIYEADQRRKQEEMCLKDDSFSNFF